MLVTANGFSVLLQALGLSQGLSKPNPSAVETNVGPDVNQTTILSAPSVLPTAADSTLGDVSNLQAQLASLPNLSPSQVLDQIDSSCSIEPYNAPPSFELTFPPFDEATANVYRYRQQQSVNLGSWYATVVSLIDLFNLMCPGSFRKSGWCRPYSHALQATKLLNWT
jgi:glucan 1,3-beta-glucosidase